MIRNLGNLLIVAFLTVLTQIGGVLYLIVIILLRRKSRKIKLLYFSITYLFFTYLIIPLIAPFFGREKITNSKSLQPRSFFYTLTNRSYVVPEMNTILQKVSNGFEEYYPGIEVVYLDANFPFFNGFPLLPHLSHNDGKKVDLSLVYVNEKGNITNRKPSISGYGVYENPTTKEYNQIEVCKRKGNWQYDFPKYLTFGTINKDLKFSKEANKKLIQLFLSQKEIGKVFIEPHLKSRLKLLDSRIRFHGCQAVRHDDHIHVQLR